MAMGNAYKTSNFITAAAFAQRLLELPEMASEKNAELRIKVRRGRGGGGCGGRWMHGGSPFIYT